MTENARMQVMIVINLKMLEQKNDTIGYGLTKEEIHILKITLKRHSPSGGTSKLEVMMPNELLQELIIQSQMRISWVRLRENFFARFLVAVLALENTSATYSGILLHETVR